MLQTEHNEIVSRAKDKKDGIYSYKGYFYVVRGGLLRAYCDYSGQIYEYAHGFNVKLLKCADRFSGKKLLKAYLTPF